MAEVETWRGMVGPQDCDMLGHMNVSRIFGISSEGAYVLQTLMGIGGSDVRGGRRLAFAAVHAVSDFLAEMRAGDALYLRTGVVEIGRSSMRLRHRLYRLEDDTLCFDTTFRVVLMDLETRRAAPLPDDLREKAEGFRIPPEDQAAGA